MTALPVGVERRIGQRFIFHLPVLLRDSRTGAEGRGFTQDLSSRGVFLFTDMPIAETTELELILKMPAEITLGESMRVRCRGRVLRVVKPSDENENKIGVAVCIKNYEYLSEVDDSSTDFHRISALHGSGESVEREPSMSISERDIVH